MARFLQLALVVVAGIALAFPQKLVSANPLDVDAGPDDDYRTGVSEPPVGEGDSVRVTAGGGPSLRLPCGGYSPAGCRAYCGSRGWPYWRCLTNYCLCYR